MKLMASGVINSAAIVRSPSFSRSSSSTTTIMRPALSSSMAVSIEAKTDDLLNAPSSSTEWKPPAYSSKSVSIEPRLHTSERVCPILSFLVRRYLIE